MISLVLVRREKKQIMDKIPYSNAIGSLMYSMVSIRPYISFAMSMLSKFMSNPRKQHWEAAKWIFRYIKGA